MLQDRFSESHTVRRRRLRLSCFLVAAALLGACGGGDPDWTGPTAATLGEQEVLGYKALRDLSIYRDANREYGKRLSQQCQKCHTLERDGAHNKGPNLHGFLGVPAGSHVDFPYSDALQTSEFVWTPRALDYWLQAPRGFLPGTSMKFSGVPDPAARAALIAYLIDATDGNRPAR